MDRTRIWTYVTHSPLFTNRTISFLNFNTSENSQNDVLPFVTPGKNKFLLFSSNENLGKHQLLILRFFISKQNSIYISCKINLNFYLNSNILTVTFIPHKSGHWAIGQILLTTVLCRGTNNVTIFKLRREREINIPSNTLIL